MRLAPLQPATVPHDLSAGIGAPLIVGRDPGDQEVRQGRPFVGWSGQRLDEALKAAGLERSACNIANIVSTQPRDNLFGAHPREAVTEGMLQLRQLIAELQPRAVLALGNEASYALVAGWPSSTADIFGAKDIGERRGYVWPCLAQPAVPVLTTFHPAGTHPRRDPAGHAAVLFMRDVERFAALCRGEGAPPERTVHVVHTEREALAAAAAIAAAGRAAADIETQGTATLACVGFAVSPTEAYVFTPTTFPAAFRLLRRPELALTFQNGQYDLYFLLTRYGVRVAGYADDTIVAWHSLYPELAGAAEGRKQAGRRTRKSLAFLASIYTWQRWWKDYDFQTDHERYVLCGRDCCTTFEIMAALQEELVAERLAPIYRQTLARVWPVVEMQQHGLLIAEDARRAAAAELAEQRAAAVARLQALAEPLLTENRAKLESVEHLVWERRTCSCCRGASKKLKRCWSCAGFAAAPSKAALLEHARRVLALDRTLSVPYKLARIKELAELSKAELEDDWLIPCKVCEGRGRWEVYAFNPASDQQVAALLYETLHLPVRTNDGRVTVDEGALKNLLGIVRGESTDG